MYCKNPIERLFNDIPMPQAQKWLEIFSWQPASGWDDVIDYAGWKDVPSVYLCCETDGILPMALQKQLAEMAGSLIERCSAGHMVMQSQPEKVLEVIRIAAGECF